MYIVDLAKSCAETLSLPSNWPLDASLPGCWRMDVQRKPQGVQLHSSCWYRPVALTHVCTELVGSPLVPPTADPRCAGLLLVKRVR